MSNRGRERATRPRSTIVAEISAVLATLTAVLAFLSNSLQLPQSVILTALAPLAGVSVLLLLATRQIYRVRHVSVIVALGGAQGVGKTAFVNVLCSRLMEDHSPLLSFVPDARTAQQVYRTITRLRKDVWPVQTSTDLIDRYRGNVALKRRTALSALLRGRVVFRLEFGDSAGENWKELSSEAAEEGPRRLIDSTFFEYIGESDALFYFLDSRDLIVSANRVEESVDDLLSTLQLLRSVEDSHPGAPLRKPIIVVLSKGDLLPFHEADLVGEFIGAAFDDHVDAELSVIRLARSSESRDFEESLRHLQRLFGVLRSQTRSCAAYLVSSLFSAVSPGSHDNGVLDVETPVEWTFTELWNRRDFIE